MQPGRGRLRSVDVEVRRIRSAIATVVAVHTRARLGNAPSGALPHIQLHSCGAHAAGAAEEVVHTRVKGLPPSGSLSPACRANVVAFFQLTGCHGCGALACHLGA